MVLASVRPDAWRRERLLDVVCMGEIMVQFNAVTRGPLRNVALFEKHAAGAEGNVAIGVSRLGGASGIITRVGNDEFGHFLRATLMAENVNTSHVAVDQDFPTAVFFIQRGFPIPDKSEAYYYRRNSDGSKLGSKDLDPKYIASAKIFHVTGVTPALSETAKEATSAAVRIAKEHNVTVSLDTNIRLKLWTEGEARTTLFPLCKMADVLFTSGPDAKIILGTDDPVEITKILHKSGVATVVVKLGEKGAFASSKGETVTQPMIHTSVEDPTGAGDSFAATFLATQLKGWKPQESLRAALATAAMVVTVRGDYENIPDMAALRTFLDYEHGKTEYLR
jgi:sugar/nucleoside kinase (ribokinase family)